MGRILVAAELQTTSSEAREQVIDALTTVSVYSKANEAGVHKYIICVPVESSDTTTVWAIEEYADKNTLDSHMASDAVKDLIAFMTNSPVLAGAPIIRQLSFVDDSDFTKPETSQQKDPFIVFADIEFSSGERDGTLKYWKGNVNSSKDESGTFVYALAQDEAKPDTLYTLEVYESEAYLWDTHVKSSAVQETMEKTKASRKDLRISKLQLRGGYVAKAS